MADELMDICDENNNIIGQGMKSRILARGLWHRTARVFVYNSKGEILMQLRSKDKELFADRWDVGAAGHVAAGEDYLRTAIREAKEELGLMIGENDLELLEIEKCQTLWGNLNEKVLAATYLTRFGGGIDEFKIQLEEVQELKFVSADELEKELKLNPKKFTPHPASYWNTLIAGVKDRTNL